MKCILLSIVLLATGSVTYGEERRYKDGTCRANRAAGWEREHLEALAILPPPTTDIEKFAVYVTKWKDSYYFHTNYYTHASKKVADAFKQWDQVPKNLQEEIRQVYKKQDGVVVYRNTSKVVMEESDLLKAVVLAIYGKELPSTPKEKASFVKAFNKKMTIFVNREVGKSNRYRLQNLKVVDFPFPPGVVCDRETMKFFEEQANRAAKHVGKPTTKIADSSLYVVTTKEGYVYVHSNYRPLLRNGERAKHPAKVAVRAEHYANSLASMHLYLPHRPDKHPALAEWLRDSGKASYYEEAQKPDGSYHKVIPPAEPR